MAYGDRLYRIKKKLSEGKKDTVCRECGAINSFKRDSSRSETYCAKCGAVVS